ncbi:MAG: hypothetical protein NC833_03140 [Candidatus Omnitrophica bacterium]|nr:hypothetical protein [Candidatus Omnitrophota bacterium]
MKKGGNNKKFKFAPLSSLLPIFQKNRLPTTVENNRSGEKWGFYYYYLK